MTEQLLTKTDLATWLQVSPFTVNDWVSAKKVPYVKVCGNVRFRKSEIDDWLSAKSVKVHWARVKTKGRIA